MTDTTHHHSDARTPDEPSLTAFALGELDPTSDVYKQVASLIETDADARAYVEQTRALGEQLHDAYHADESSVGLADHQHRELSAMIDQQDHNKPTPTATNTRDSATARQPFRMPRKLLLAAGLAIAAGAAVTTITLLNDKPDVERVAKDDAKIVNVAGLSNVKDAIAQPVTVDFDNATLGEVLAFLNKQTGVAFDADWSALKHRGVDRDTRVSLASDTPQPARDVLGYALRLAWAQSPHPDPAEWAMDDAGITIAPRSTLAQARLDATAKLLNARRFSQAPVDDAMLRTSKAKVWDTGLWNDILSKRAEAGERVLEEADASLDAAEKAAAKGELEAASDHGLYAYQLLAMNATLIKPAGFESPMKRIGALQETLAQQQAEQDKAAIVKAVEDAKADDREATAYESAMLAAVEALENQSFKSATDAITLAQTQLAEGRGEIEASHYSELAARTTRLHNAIYKTRWQYEAERIAQTERELEKRENQATSAEDKQKAEALRALLTSARSLQQQRQYERAADELDTALSIEPDNPAIAGYRDMLRDSRLAVESTRLGRHRELREAELGLVKLDAKPGKAAPRRQQGQQAAGEWGAGVGWHDGYSDYAFKEAGFRSGDVADRFVSDLQPAAASLFDSGKLAEKKGSSLSERDRLYFSNAPGFDLNSALSGSVSGGQPSPTRMDGLSFVGGAVGGPPPSPVADPAALAPNRPALRGTFGVDATDSKDDLDFELRVNQSLALDRPNAEQPRGEILAKVIDELEEAEPEAEASREELRRAEVEALKRHLARTAATEKQEARRIEAIKELRELERRFIEQQQQDIIIDPRMDRDAYAMVNDNPFYNPANENDNGQNRAISTFSVDVDTAAYSLVRRQLMQQGRLPVPGAVRIEELINYFDYDYDAPVVDGRALEDGIVTQASLEKFEKEQEGFAPFATDIQVTDCPWQKGHQLVRIGIQGMEVAQDERPPAHLTFLIDVSGSMSSANKLGLVKQSLTMLLDKLNADDHVSIVVYAGRTRTVLENASAADKDAIAEALDALKSGGSTAGAAGIQLAYDAAQKHFIDGGVNRVILCTDGDFNVGISDTDDLVDLIKQKANPEPDVDGKRRGVYLSVMGYGMGNLNDRMMEPLTNAGNGTYAYIDTLEEATKVMYDQAGSTLVTIAKDVKVQVHFDPQQVMAYRLIGYENRVLANEDFDNDKVDAGDIGAGHSVTALYEVVPFNADGLIDDNEAIRVVKQQVEALEEAIALNASLMQTCSLTQEQELKLAGSTKMLEQERVLCEAAIERLEARKAPADEAEAQPADAGAADGDKPAGPELDTFEDGAMMSVKLRYKPVDAPAEDGTSRKLDNRVFAKDLVKFELADETTRFAAAVASYGMQLRSSPHAGDVDLYWVIDTAEAASTHDPGQLRAKFVELVAKTIQLMPVEEDVAVENPGVPK
ncbi:MAG: von Willebrand factor type A domain-containing protein [Phycisphaeraceae bacterium]